MTDEMSAQKWHDLFLALIWSIEQINNTLKEMNNHTADIAESVSDIDEHGVMAITKPYVET